MIIFKSLVLMLHRAIKQVNRRRRSANHADATTTRTSNPSHVANERRKRRRTTRMCPQRTPAPTTKSPMQEAPSHQPRQMHVEQDIQRISFQIHLRQAQGGFQATPQVYGGTGWVRGQRRFGEQMTVHRDGGCWEKGWYGRMDQDWMEGQLYEQNDSPGFDHYK